MRETVESIATWADETFGPSTPMRTLVRANEEASELMTHLIKNDKSLEAAMEAVDIFIVLCRYYRDRPSILLSEAMKEGKIFSGISKSNFETAVLISKKLNEIILHETRSSFHTGTEAVGIIYIIRTLLDDLGVNFTELVDAKMEINRIREWRRDGTGAGQHVEASAS